jgi:hypothetical protein
MEHNLSTFTTEMKVSNTYNDDDDDDDVYLE